MIRLYLYNLKQPNEAFALAREMKDPQCAETVADFARRRGDNHAAIEFFIISDQLEHAFEVAKEEELFPVFGKFLLRQRQHTAFQNYASTYFGVSLSSHDCQNFMLKIKFSLTV